MLHQKQSRMLVLLWTEGYHVWDNSYLDGHILWYFKIHCPEVEFLCCNTMRNQNCFCWLGLNNFLLTEPEHHENTRDLTNKWEKNLCAKLIQSFIPQHNPQHKQSPLLHAAYMVQDSFLNCCSFVWMSAETELSTVLNTWKREASCVTARKHNCSHCTLPLLSLCFLKSVK